jgi:hypothetical protein
VQQVPPGQRVRDAADPQVLDRDPVRATGSDRPADRHREVDAVGQGVELERRARQGFVQLQVAPDVGTTGAGPLADTDQRADLVVGPAGGEQVT